MFGDLIASTLGSVAACERAAIPEEEKMHVAEIGAVTFVVVKLHFIPRKPVIQIIAGLARHEDSRARRGMVVVVVDRSWRLCVHAQAYLHSFDDGRELP